MTHTFAFHKNNWLDTMVIDRIPPKMHREVGKPYLHETNCVLFFDLQKYSIVTQLLHAKILEVSAACAKLVNIPSDHPFRFCFTLDNFT